MSDGKVSSQMIDREKLPEWFPTHPYTPQFWEMLGRTIGSFGFLEDVLGRAIFAFTATQRYPPEKIEEAFEKWLPTLKRALTDQLWNLIETYAKAVKENPEATIANIDGLTDSLKKAAKWRNVLCHGSWHGPDAKGCSNPFFVNRKLEVFDSQVSIDNLKSIQKEVSHLICDVIDTVTRMGWQFPGGAGEGKRIWS